MCRELGISEQTYHRWPNQYGGPKADDAKRLKQLEKQNSRLRDECLTINSFNSLLYAQVVIGDWKTKYNHQRRHPSLGYLPPAGYARQCAHQIATDGSRSNRTE